MVGDLTLSALLTTGFSLDTEENQKERFPESRKSWFTG
jgi:hypothetical protein